MMTTVKHSNIKLIVMLLVAVLPIGLATYLFNSTTHGGAINKGELIIPPVDITKLDMRNGQGELIFSSFEDEAIIRPWLMIYLGSGSCNDVCQRRLYYLRQLHTALGKNSRRVQRYYVETRPSDTDSGLDNKLSALIASEFPKLKIAFSGYDPIVSNFSVTSRGVNPVDKHFVFLVDPVGNVMMYYTPEHTPKEIMEDLKRLLKLSSLG